MPYMNVTEVESALIAIAATHPATCQLITLPHQTVEGRTTHAVRIGTQPANAVDIFYLTGGVHAREWGSCEILVNLAVDLCDAYANGTGIAYGGKLYSNRQVRAIMEGMNILIFPCVNPDGRNLSQNGTPMWRKNRNPADSGGDPNKIGVDINRNQDFLWDFRTAFSASAASNISLASDDPSIETYHGHAPHTEAETQNIVWLHDQFPRIKWYIDVHSFSQDILYIWGNDEMQISDANMNFRNHSFDGQRGLPGDGYKEYIEDGDALRLVALARSFTQALSEVRGKYYVAKPGFSLYATSGTNDDYAYSRHIVNSSQSKALAFTVEWGEEFQPTWTEMQEIIKDVCSGFLGFAAHALGIESYIVTDRDTFSSYELESTHDFPASFYVIYDGFTPNSFGVPGASPDISFRDSINGSVIHSITATVSSVDLEDASALNTSQRISFTYQVHFNNANAFTAETRNIYLQASFGGIQDVAQLHLIMQPNPYMLDGPVSWLSTDVRVFQLRPGQKVNNNSNVILGDPNSNSNAPIAYIQALLTELRAFGNNAALPFENIPQDEQSSHLELSRTVGGVRVLNFAVAKVRYRANTQDATDVRVFFRTFNTMVSDLSYTNNTTAQLQNYRRNSGGTIPLLGTNSFFNGAGNQVITIPYFAEPRVNTASASMTTQTDNWNKHSISHAVNQEAVMYFGCWLDFNQTEPQFPAGVSGDGPFSSRLPIMQLVRGIHQCLVAEIRFQPGATDPISNGATPGSSDRLAQRNLAIVESDNPGDPSTHVVQHTLLLKPSSQAKRSSAPVGASKFDYDELVIRWNEVPKETIASLYLPACKADDIISLTAAIRNSDTYFKKQDEYTISFVVKDTSYIPLPPSDKPYAGLLSLQLPQTVRTGQQFFVDAQQHSGGVSTRTMQTNSEFRRENFKQNQFSYSHRKVLGAFRLRILVKNGEDLLGRAVRNLAVLKYIALGIPVNDIWYPVFQRYIEQLADKLKGLGIDPGLILPSPDDPGIPGHESTSENEVCYTGKVNKVLYNCFGEFQGFILESCCSDNHHIKCCESGIGQLVLLACKEHLWITVCLSKKEKNKVCGVMIQNRLCNE